MPTKPTDLRQLEWEQIGNELHDGPCQYIVSAQMLLEALCLEKDDSPDGKGHRLDMAMELLRQANAELRRLIRGLQPLELSDTPTRAIVERLSDENELSAGPEIEWCFDVEFNTIPSHLKAPLFRILQECLANIRRHSKTSKALIGVTQDEQAIYVQVQDWGVGFDPGKTGSQCLGLKGIRQRAQLLGGAAYVTSDPGRGTCVTVELPLGVQDMPTDTEALQE
jgi:signal transduction histidine kinase